MKLNQLREKQALFQSTYSINAVTDIRRRLELFYEDYPITSIQYLSSDDYVYGRYHLDYKKTFCYWMEKELGDFGLIAGSPCSQYGVWYGTRGKDDKVRYRNTQRYGDSVETALDKLKYLIQELYHFGEARDYQGIANSMIADKFKGKILTTYFPDTYISIYADFYLNDILRYFNLDEGNSFKEAPIYKQLRLIKWKEEDEVMRNWDLPKFAMFINDEMRLHFYDREKDWTEEQSFPKFPELGVLDISFESLEIKKDFWQEKKKIKVHSRSKPDYVRKTIRSMAIGTRGEQIVKEFEQRKLNKYPILRKQVNWISEETDGQGYDIVSFETDGTPMQIEVKSTTKPFVGKAEFFLTEFERSVASELPNYYVYYLSEVLSSSPKIWAIRAPFAEGQQGVLLSPTAYFVEIRQNLKP